MTTGDDPTSFVLGGTGGLRRREAGAVRNWLAVASVAVVVVLPLRGLYHTTGGTMEEAFMIYFPERMWHGDVPNVDFLHLYGPGSLHVLALWYKVFGYGLSAERTFALIQHLGIIYGIYTLARAWGRTVAVAAGVVAVFLVILPITMTAMAWNGAQALVLWAVVAALRAIHGHPAKATRRWVTAGVLGGFALTYRPDMIVAVALVGAWLAWVSRRTAAGMPWRPLLIGSVVGLLPMWIHLGMAGIGPAFEGMFIDPVLHLRGGRSLPSPPSWERLDGALQAIAETQPPWWKVPHLGASKELFLWFFAMLTLAVGLPIYAAWDRRRTVRSATPTSLRSTVLLAGALIGIGILPQGIQRPDSTHLSFVSCVSWPLAIAAATDVLRRRRMTIDVRRLVAGSSAAMAALMLLVTPMFTFRYYLLHVRVGVGQVQTPFPVERDGRTFYMGAFGAARATQQTLDYLDTRVVDGQRLFVGPADLRRTWYSDVYFYWMFPELDPATYYIEMDPGLANAADSSLADDLASADWVILTRFWDGWYEPNTSMEYGSDRPNQVLAEDFCEAASFENGLVVVYQKCDRVAG